MQAESYLDIEIEDNKVQNVVSDQMDDGPTGRDPENEHISHLAMRKEVNDSLLTAARSCFLVGRGKCCRARLTGGFLARRRNSSE